MKSFFTKNRIILINTSISFIAILISALLTHQLTKFSEIETRQYEANRDGITIVLRSVSNYANYFDVDWETLDKKIYSDYQCSWDDHEDYDEIIQKNGVQAACYKYDTLQKAKKDFHDLTVEARIIGSNEMLAALLGVENGFDEVFIQYINTEYYGRSFIDSYNDIMPDRFLVLESSIRKALQ